MPPLRATQTKSGLNGDQQGDEDLLWRRLRETGDEEARRALLERHMPYARIVATSYFAKRHTDAVEFGDYLQYAAVGLLEAMERYDPGAGAKFRTFAARRMHGSILDGLVKLTERHQQSVARQRMEAERLQAVKELASEAAGTKPGAQPKTTEQLFKFVSEVGLGLALGWMLEGTSMLDDPDRAESIPFYADLETRQLREQLLKAVDRLPVQERTVIRSHYMQDIPFEEIATTLNLTRGRISQIHKQGLVRLRTVLCDPQNLNVLL